MRPDTTHTLVLAVTVRVAPLGASICVTNEPFLNSSVPLPLTAPPVAVSDHAPDVPEAGNAGSEKAAQSHGEAA